MAINKPVTTVPSTRIIEVWPTTSSVFRYEKRTFKKTRPISGLECPVGSGKFPGMKTLTVDDHKRVRIPDAKPRQVFSYEPESDGTIRLVPVKAEAKEQFPRGSLLKYLTPERDKEQLAILKGCVQAPE